jgi:hypothetical protein
VTALGQRIEIQLTVWLISPPSLVLFHTLDGFRRDLPVQTDSCQNRLAAVYSLSTITSLSSDSSCSNYASDHSTGSRDSCDKIPPQDIIDTLNLLEQVEQEVSHEVARIQDKIKEARMMVEAYRREKRARMKENATLVAEEERQTRKADDELWLVV